jgi:glutamate synthase domain-containing protein 3
MTGGRVVILGQIGRNFAAGMSGGVVFMLQDAADRATHWKRLGVHVEHIAGTEDERLVRHLVDRHARYTGSRAAKRMLAHWPDAARAFIRIMPEEYKRALAALDAALDAKSESPRYG